LLKKIGTAWLFLVLSITHTCALGDSSLILGGFKKPRQTTLTISTPDQLNRLSKEEIPKTITALTLSFYSDVVPGWHEILETVLSKNKQISCLNFKVRYATAPQLIDLFEALKQSTWLHTVRLCDVMIDKLSAPKFEDWVKKTETLREFFFCASRTERELLLPDCFAKALASNTSIETLDFSDCFIPPIQLSEILRVLANKANLKVLRLRDDALSIVGLEHLADILEKHTQLEEFSLYLKSHRKGHFDTIHKALLKRKKPLKTLRLIPAYLK